MKKNELKKLNIAITGDENNKTEIVYNNVIQNMNLTSEEQINYLRNKINELELENKNRSLTSLLILISIIGVGFGLFLLIQDVYFLGSLFIITTFIGVVVRFYLMYKNVTNLNKNIEYEKIEQIRRLLEERLK